MCVRKRNYVQKTNTYVCIWSFSDNEKTWVKVRDRLKSRIQCEYEVTDGCVVKMRE